MRKTLAFAAVASLSAFAFVGYDSSVIAQDAKARVEVGDAGASGRLSLPQGITRTDRTDRADEVGIRRTLGGVVEALLHEGKPSRGFTTYLSNNDRSRLNNFTPNDQLAMKLKQFHRDFKAKYNRDFDINEEIVFGDQYRNFYVVQGEVSNPALLSNWPVDARGTASTTNTEIRTNTNTNTEIRTNTTIDGKEKAPGTGGPGNPVDANKNLNQGPGAGGGINTTVTTERDAKGPSTGGPGTPDRRTTGGGAGGINTTVTTDRDAKGPSTGGPGTVDNRTTAGGGGNAGVIVDRDTTTTVTGGRSSTFDRGMNVAVVSFPSGHGAPETHVSLVREPMAAGGAGAGGGGADVNVRTTERGDARLGPGTGGPGNPVDPNNTTGAGNTTVRTEVRAEGRDGANLNAGGGDWKVDLADNMTSDQLQMSLIKHLDEINSMRDQWPADANEFHRMVSHHMLLALYDTNAGARGGVELRGGDRNVDRNVNVDRSIDRDVRTTDRDVKVDVRTSNPDNKDKAPGTGGPGNPVQPNDPATGNK